MAARKLPSVSSIRQLWRQAAEESGLTPEEIGVRMGFAKSGARQAISRLLSHHEYDPRLSTLIAFASAINKPLKDLVP